MTPFGLGKALGVVSSTELPRDRGVCEGLFSRAATHANNKVRHMREYGVCVHIKPTRAVASDYTVYTLITCVIKGVG